jgi:hypothetical protein
LLPFLSLYHYFGWQALLVLQVEVDRLAGQVVGIQQAQVF